MSDQQIELAKLGIQALMAVVIVVLMTWIVLSPATSDEASKAALVIVGSAVGFLFGRHTAT